MMVYDIIDVIEYLPVCGPVVQGKSPVQQAALCVWSKFRIPHAQWSPSEKLIIRKRLTDSRLLGMSRARTQISNNH